MSDTTDRREYLEDAAEFFEFLDKRRESGWTNRRDAMSPIRIPFS